MVLGNRANEELAQDPYTVSAFGDARTHTLCVAKQTF